MNKTEIKQFRDEAHHHLTTELLPFWTSRMKDETNGGYITHFDKNGNDTGEDEKSLIAQTRCLYTISSAHRAGYGNGELATLAKHGADFIINKMWDTESWRILLDDGQERKCKNRQKNIVRIEFRYLFAE
jgi:mannose 2-epimerase